MTSPRRVPDGKPVSQALSILATLGPIHKLQNAIAAVDSVHGDGELTKISVDVRQTLPDRKIAIFQVDNITNLPLEIAISGNSPSWEMSLLHEIGHFLDWSALGDNKFYYSIGGSKLNEWRRLVHESQTVIKLKYCLDNLYLVPDPIKKEKVDLSNIARYFLQENELFARSYAQYIAERSEDPILKSELNSVLNGSPALSLSQWQSQEFTIIAAEFDRLFRSWGWQK